MDKSKGAYPLYNSIDLGTKSLLISRDMAVKTQDIAVIESQGERLMDEEKPPKLTT